MQRGSVVDQVSFPGKVILGNEQDLYFDVTGRVDTVYIDSGQLVAVDEPIAALDARGREFDVADARMAVELAQERVSAAEEDWTFAKQAADMELAIAERRLLALQSMVNPDPLELYVQGQQGQQAQLEVNRLDRGVDPKPGIELERARLALDRAQEALAETRLTAPAAGQVLFLKPLQQGTAVSAFDPVAALVDPDSIQIEANLVPSELESFYEGMPVQVIPQTRPNLILTGAIASLPQPVGTGTGTTTVIELETSESRATLRPGATVEVKAELRRADNVLWTPLEALRGTPDAPSVLVSEGGKVREVAVQVGVRNGERVEIVSGLSEGDEVLVG